MGGAAVRLLGRYPMRSNSELIYAKIEVGIALDGNPLVSLFQLAAMELGSNILKHGGGQGELWLLEEQGDYFVVALDRGPGIANVTLALKGGYSTYHTPSLGIGLSSLARQDGFSLQIVTLTSKKIHGTVVLFGPQRPSAELYYLSLPFDPRGNGDFFERKGHLLLFGDAAGHGRLARQTVDFVRERFRAELRSFLLVDEWFGRLHHQLQERQMRPVELAVIALDRTQVAVAGVGSLTLWYPEGGSYRPLGLRSGSIGEVIGKFSFLELERRQPIFLTTDGILSEAIPPFLPQLDQRHVLAWICALLFFCGSLSDDASLLMIMGEPDES